MPIPTNPNMGRLDFNQIFQRVFDEVNDRLRVEAIINTTIGDVEVSLLHTEDSVALGDGVGLITSTVIGPKRAVDVYIAGGNLVLDVELDAADGDNVAISDGTDTLDINADGSINTVVVEPIQYKILNIPLTLADTEYNFSLPSSARRMEMKIRDSRGPLRIYESSGASSYYTVSRGSYYDSKDIKPTALSFYVQSSQGASVLEVLYWEI